MSHSVQLLFVNLYSLDVLVEVEGRWEAGQGGSGACAVQPALTAGVVPPGQPTLSPCASSQQESSLAWLVFHLQVPALQFRTATHSEPFLAAQPFWYHLHSQHWPAVSPRCQPCSACTGKSLSTVEFLMAQDACWIVGSACASPGLVAHLQPFLLSCQTHKSPGRKDCWFLRKLLK